MSKSPARRLAAAAIVVLGFVLVGAAYWKVVPAKSTGSGGDYIGYWAAGQQLAHHQNPYDEAAVLAIERTEGFEQHEPSISPSPPAAWVLLLPLGYLSAKAGQVGWVMLQLACVALAMRLLWSLHGEPQTLIYLFGFIFPPVLVCLIGGQIGIFLLFSLVVFFYLLQRQPLLAGAALLPCALKPHLLLAFFVVLALWSFHRRNFKPLMGFCAALLASAAVVLLFDPHIWLQYLEMWRTGAVKDRVTPTLSVALRSLIDDSAHWIEFAPALAACVWAGWFYWTRRTRWLWLDHGLVVLLVAVMCAPYSWFTDESVVLVAVMTAAIRARNSWKLLLPLILAVGTALIEVSRAVDIKLHGYIWTTPAWLLCFLVATRVKSVKHASNIPRSTPAELD